VTRPRSLWSKVPQRTRKAIREAVFARDEYRCRLELPGCTRIAEEVDHVLRASSLEDPLLYDTANIRASCRRCNRLRGADQEAEARADGKSRRAETWPEYLARRRREGYPPQREW
jgi:5-methylcytosine-specific restriction endonuclease McrA